MPQRKSMLVSAVVVLLLSVSGNAVASTCWRWQNGMTECSLFPTPGCYSPTPDQTHTAKQWIYSDTAEDACKKYERNYWGANFKINGVDREVAAGPSTGGNRYVWNCYVDANGDGRMSSYEATVAHTTVTLTEVTKDWCCDVEVWGPYTGLGVDPAPGDGYFTSTQKTTARAQNEINGWMYSDTNAFAMPNGSLVDYFQQLYYHPSVYAADDDGGPYLYILAEAAGELDHIIPRKDSHGCMCGSNSWRNMQIISRQLNREMSNKCYDERRIRIIQHFSGGVLPPP